jgi:hypothetical protein
MLLCGALAIHVADETLTDFLSVYNPVASRLRERIPWLPIPVFTFEVWLFGLIFAVSVLLLFSGFAFRGSRWLRPLAYFFAVLMIGNAALHTIGSFYLGGLMPGVISSPILFAAAVFLLVALRQTKKIHVASDSRN